MAAPSLQLLRPNFEVLFDFPLSYVPSPVQQESLALASEDVWNPTPLDNLHCHHHAPSHYHLWVDYWNSILTIHLLLPLSPEVISQQHSHCNHFYILQIRSCPHSIPCHVCSLKSYNVLRPFIIHPLQPHLL